MKTISILGSTGSIGTQAVDLVLAHPERFRVVGLAAGRNVALMERQARRLRPLCVAMASEAHADELRKRLAGLDGVEVMSGPEGLETVATLEAADFVVSSIVGAEGLMPTLAAIRAGKTVGLANKESLVASGRVMMEAARRHGTRLLPIDSEHSAIFQCLDGAPRGQLRKIILTASGGALRTRPVEELPDVTVEEALDHPNWSMGRKITIDSATLMNKGLEVIEARWLFDLEPGEIEVVIHPQSIIHSMVEFVDGSVLAQMSRPDMRGPISYALAYPERVAAAVEPLDLVSLGSLSFEAPDPARFPCLGLALDAMAAGGTLPAVMNAANEVAVDAFLAGRIRFGGIPELVRAVMEGHAPTPATEIGEVMEALAWGRTKAEEILRSGRVPATA